MKLGWRITIASLIALVGYGGLLLHDLYIKPYVLASTVVVIKTNQDVLEKYHVLQSSDVAYKKVAKESIPDNAIVVLDNVIGKRLTVDASNNQILTKHMVDVFEFHPSPDAPFFPIPRDAIYSINGSLRIYDRVDIYLYKPTSDQNEEDALNELLESGPFIQSALVVHVRSDDNNDVMDSDIGNVNDRRTSTGRISLPELKLSKDDGSKLRDALQMGYKLWIVRIE